MSQDASNSLSDLATLAAKSHGVLGRLGLGAKGGAVGNGFCGACAPQTTLGKSKMKHLSVLLLALVAASAGAEERPTAAEDSAAAGAEIDDFDFADCLAACRDEKHARWELEDFDISKLSAEERRRLDAHEGGIPTHPPMTYDALGVRYEPIFDLPVSTFHEELTVSPYNDYVSAGRDLHHKFNIQLLSPWHRIKWPPTTTLLVELSKNGASKSLALEMELRDGDSYYLQDPFSLAAGIGEAMISLGQFPRMKLTRLEGFEFNSRTIANMPPLARFIHEVRS